MPYTPASHIQLMFVASIYTLEKSLNQSLRPQAQDAESSPLLDGSTDPDPVFSRALDSELEKICSFYQLKELEIYGEVADLTREKESYTADTDGIDNDQLDGSRTLSRGGRQRQGSIFRNFGFGRPRRASTLSASLDEVDEGESDDEGDERTALNRRRSMKERSKTWDANAGQSIDDLRSSRELPARNRRPSQAFEDYSDHAFSALYDSGITLKKRTVGLYVSLCELKSFIQLNKTGFSKALKKYDKTLDRNLKSRYIDEKVAPSYPFRPATMQYLNDNVTNIEKIYADVVTNGDVSVAKKELRLHLREHVVWERNTVWREMIGIERKAQAANMGLKRTLLGGDNDPSKAQLQGDEADGLETKEVVTPVGRLSCPTWLFSSTFFTLLVILIIFIILLMVPIMEKQEQQNCLAMLIFVSLLWATEVGLSVPNILIC